MQSRDSASAIRPLRLVIAASIVFPLALFAYASWSAHRSAWASADERIERALDVLQEHALKVFETIELTLETTDEVLRGFGDAEIRAEEPRFHARLKKLHEGLLEIGAVLVFDRHGRLLISTADLPAPTSVDFSDRDYFKVHVERDASTYIGDVLVPRVSSIYFFNVSRRRPAPDGGFNGVTAVSVLPKDLKVFYARLGKGIAFQASLIRADGAFLARHPSPDERPLRLRADSVFGRAIESHPEAGIFSAISQIDSIERRIGYRKIPAFPADILPRIFEPFFTTKEVDKGTGLGLSQVYGFANQSGGTVTASSTVGVGTTITLYLPRSREYAGARDLQERETAPARGDGDALLVEDNAEVAEVARECLEELGYRVTFVSNASAALQLIEAGRGFDLVFSDIIMPGGMSGLDLAQRVREIRPGLPVLLATGYSHSVQTGAARGFSIIAKPYTAASLATAIQALEKRMMEGAADSAERTQ